MNQFSQWAAGWAIKYIEHIIYGLFDFKQCN